MIGDSKTWAAINCLSLFIVGAHTITMSASSNAATVYGAQQGASVTNQRHTQYMLQLAAFKHKQYAIDYRNKIASRTNEPVHILHRTDSPIPYRVVIGPFQDVHSLQQVSQRLLSHSNEPLTQAKPISHSAPIHQTNSSLTPNGAQKIVTLSVGPTWSRPTNTQTIRMEPNIRKAYISTNGTSSLITGEVFLGMERPLHPKINGQIGVAVAGASNVNLSGDGLEDANPNFNNFIYKYNVNHAHVALKGKLLTPVHSLYQPYVSGSVGVGFNHAYSFNLTPKIFEEVPYPLFQPSTTTALSYTLGVGVERVINTQWKFGLGYDFADWGRSQLAAAPGQTMGQGPALNHIYTNELLLSLTYKPKQ